jgi:glycosyltransferase involved in cell wall biosynthesis
MRITFVLPHAGLAGGIRVVAIYAEWLKKRGHQVYVVSLPLQPIPLRRQIKSLLKGQGWLSNHEPSHFDQRDVEHHILEQWRPITEADVPDADVVIATWWETAEWVAKFSPAKGAKAYFIQHYEALEGQPKERVKATWSLPMHKITIAQWLVDLAQTQSGDNQVSLVPNSVDAKQFYAPPRGKQSVPTIGMMYSRVKWKGCDTSLKAFSIAAEKIHNLRLVAFGSDLPSAELPLPSGTEYAYCPPQENIKDFYAQCDAWLFGSTTEGFGMPLLEAMACRTPVIGTPAGAAPELLAGGAGILVQPQDPEGMARAIEQVFQMTEAEWRAMSDLAYTKATDYTWDDATQLFEAALCTAIERSKQGELDRSTPPKNTTQLQTQT